MIRNYSNWTIDIPFLFFLEFHFAVNKLFCIDFWILNNKLSSRKNEILPIIV